MEYTKKIKNNIPLVRVNLSGYGNENAFFRADLLLFGSVFSWSVMRISDQDPHYNVRMRSHAVPLIFYTNMANRQ